MMVCVISIGHTELHRILPVNKSHLLVPDSQFCIQEPSDFDQTVYGLLALLFSLIPHYKYGTKIVSVNERRSD